MGTPAPSMRVGTQVERLLVAPPLELGCITVRGSAEMMQDVLELVTSASVVLLCLDMVPVQSSRLSSIATSPSMRFVETITHVTLSSLPSITSKIPDEVVGSLVRLSHLEHLEVNGWDVASNFIVDYFVTSQIKRLQSSNPSIFPTTATQSPCHSGSRNYKPSPELRSLRCRLDNLLDIPGYSVPAHIPFPHLLETLTVGDTQPRLDSEAVLGVAQYLDRLFPELKAIKPLKGISQNADQWRYIDKLVKFRQSGRQETSPGAFSM